MAKPTTADSLGRPDLRVRTTVARPRTRGPHTDAARELAVLRTDGPPPRLTTRAVRRFAFHPDERVACALAGRIHDLPTAVARRSWAALGTRVGSLLDQGFGWSRLHDALWCAALRAARDRPDRRAPWADAWPATVPTLAALQELLMAQFVVLLTTNRSAAERLACQFVRTTSSCLQTHAVSWVPRPTVRLARLTCRHAPLACPMLALRHVRGQLPRRAAGVLRAWARATLAAPRWEGTDEWGPWRAARVTLGWLGSQP